MITDVVIYESGDGGDLFLINQDIQTTEGIANQAYLALFGGNIEQSTSSDLPDNDQRFDWWGNSLLETENQFNSNFEKTINKIALNSSGVSKLIDAAKKDLKYLQKYADIDINAQITGINKLILNIQISEPNDQTTKIKILWDGAKNEVITEKII